MPKQLWAKDLQNKIKDLQKGKKPTKRVKNWAKEKLKKTIEKVRSVVSYVPPEGLFSQDAEIIAKQLKKDSKDLRQAMGRLTFYINRSGKNLSSERRKTLEHAKEILRTLF